MPQVTEDQLQTLALAAAKHVMYSHDEALTNSIIEVVESIACHLTTNTILDMGELPSPKLDLKPVERIREIVVQELQFRQ